MLCNQDGWIAHYFHLKKMMLRLKVLIGHGRQWGLNTIIAFPGNSLREHFSGAKASSLSELLSWLQMVSPVLATCKMPLSAHETSITTVAAARGYVRPKVARKQNETWRRKEGIWAEQCRAKLELSAVKQHSCFQQGSRFAPPHPASTHLRQRYKAIYSLALLPLNLCVRPIQDWIQS